MSLRDFSVEAPTPAQSELWRAILRAAERGVLWAITIVVALGIVGLSAGWLIGDIAALRVGAQQGAAAFKFLNDQLEAQKKSATAPDAPAAK